MKKISKVSYIILLFIFIFIILIKSVDSIERALEGKNMITIILVAILSLLALVWEPSKIFFTNKFGFGYSDKCEKPLVSNLNLINQDIVTRLASNNSYNEKTYIDKDNCYYMLYREDIFPRDDKNYYSIRIISGKRLKKSNSLVYLECTENNVKNFLDNIVAYDLINKTKIEPIILANENKRNNGKIHYISFPLDDKEKNFKIGFYVFVEKEWDAINEEIMSISLTRIEKIKKLYFKVTLPKKPKAVLGTRLTDKTTTELSIKCLVDHTNDFLNDDNSIIEGEITYLKQKIPKLSTLYENTKYSITLSESDPKKELYVIQWEE